MSRYKKTWFLLVGLAFLVTTLFFPAMSQGAAEPSKSQVMKMWDDQHNVKGRVLDVKSRGGQRTTNEIHGKQYLAPVATCWDYDIVELQKCGCRLFIKSSACCRTGSSKDCELRIGNSKMVDCAPYGKPQFGLAGNTEPSECKSQRVQSSCWKRKDLVFGAGYVIGPCRGSNERQDWPPSFICPKGQETVQEFLDKKCGPTPEDCGCTIVEECSTEEGLKCYREWKTTQGSLPGGINQEKANDAAKSALDAVKTRFWK